jgi:hypothetical protein
MHPFLNVSKLSDEEILERLGKAYTFMNAQKQLGHDPTVHSIKEVIESLELERQNRMMNTVTEEYKRKYPDAEKPIELGKLED